jgi:hypothetical protein
MLFRIAGKCKCSDPRDKVYALMALLPQTLTAKIEPQYSLSVCEVFMQMMLASIANTQRLNLICFQGEKTSGQNLPSWVPNLAGIKAEYRKIPWATASGSSAAHSMFVHPNQLHVSGVSYTTIEAVHTEKWSDLASASRLAWQCWFGNKETEIYPTGEHTDEVYTWTLSCGRFRERWPQSVVVPTFTDARAIFQQLRDDHDVNEIDKHDSWLNEISHTLNGHQFFRCKEGYVGWGHEDAQVGDQVCIILGYQHPILLRPVQNGLFKIIGRCYVHGVIDAQAVLGPLPRPWRVVLRRSTWFDGASSLVERYVNSETHEETPQDPRLGELPETWEEIEKEDSTGIGFMVQHYKNRETNETINSDPRLLPHALKARGITLETFALV